MATRVVLIVDDDHDIRETLADVLEVEGYVSERAANGQEALALLERGLRPCVVLLDLMMPIMNGWDLLTRMKQDPKLASIPVFSITAGQVGAPLADRQLRKPIQTEDLLRAIAERCDEP
jgi:CheY-like chemotaxis protein